MRIHPVTGEYKFHNGVDMAVPSNTPIYAPANGQVLNAYSNSAGGNQLVIKHPSEGIRTGYAHLNKSLVKEGQTVRKGQKIALTGNTGRSTGPHLHFTVKDLQTNDYVNPLSLSWNNQHFDIAKYLMWGAVIGGGIYLYSRYAKNK